MVRVRVVRRRARAQRPGRVHVVHVRAGVLPLCHGPVQHQRRGRGARRPADGRGRDGRHRRPVRQREHRLHRTVRPSQDLALVR